MEQSASDEENGQQADNVDATDEKGAESHYEASAEGKTILKSTGEIVNVQEVADTSNGQMVLRLDNGSTVNAEDVSFSSAGEALVYPVAWHHYAAGSGMVHRYGVGIHP